MKVLLTGGTGYIGHQLALALSEKNITVHALVRDINSSKLPRHKNIKIFEGNICDFNSILKAIHECDYVFHTAAYTNLKCKNIHDFYNTNVLGTEHILKAACQNKVKKVIYTSTLSVFGPSYKDIPISELQPRLTSFSNDYELTKFMSEEKVLEYYKKGLSCIVLNVSKVYGPGLKTFSNGINSLISMFVNKDILVVPDNLKITSNYVFIEDVIDAHILAMESNIVKGKYIIGGENSNYENLFETIKTLTKSNIKILKVNYGFIKTGLLTLNLFRSLVGAQSMISVNILNSLFTNRISTSEKAIEELKYKPTKLKVGLANTINHL
ncbi:NAD-dependent epimerase/dehydratase family protein [Cognatitamlana onchidii]|uniref:NAD-dependent epimerase/dehydratase family protein n=1 Tax=Cognatitamlana onchidii TaxID=2562860 RepID=UPI0010A60767|nr:NAD-dependent epimerase/dehydratase family protein [Algibacter onchidii]